VTLTLTLALAALPKLKHTQGAGGLGELTAKLFFVSDHGEQTAFKVKVEVDRQSERLGISVICNVIHVNISVLF
jgi:endonuclease III